MPLRSGVLILPATAPPFALPRAPALGRSLSHFWGLVDGRADPSTALRNLCRGCLNFRRDRRLVADHFVSSLLIGSSMLSSRVDFPTVGKSPRPKGRAAPAMTTKRERPGCAGVQGPMAATNKCFAQSNKSRHVSRATKKRNAMNEYRQGSLQAHRTNVFGAARLSRCSSV
jgi:hypothetical protein